MDTQQNATSVQMDGLAATQTAMLVQQTAMFELMGMLVARQNAISVQMDTQQNAIAVLIGVLMAQQNATSVQSATSEKSAEQATEQAQILFLATQLIASVSAIVAFPEAYRIVGSFVKSLLPK
ncbi:hypothetical protein B484DRAFT_33265 [Ochromonadaceae sp. CCMP2298]|nr:hypothetical protein B484DRAFT_33265 [Ochromonadaceae sp. CCMP2298]